MLGASHFFLFKAELIPAAHRRHCPYLHRRGNRLRFCPVQINRKNSMGSLSDIGGIVRGSLWQENLPLPFVIDKKAFSPPKNDLAAFSALKRKLPWQIMPGNTRRLRPSCLACILLNFNLYLFSLAYFHDREILKIYMRKISHVYCAKKNFCRYKTFCCFSYILLKKLKKTIDTRIRLR